MYATQLQHLERRALLGALGVKDWPGDRFDEELGVAGWPRGGDQRRVAATVAAEDLQDQPGLTPPTWWQDDEQASQTFLGAMGARLE